MSTSEKNALRILTNVAIETAADTLRCPRDTDKYAELVGMNPVDDFVSLILRFVERLNTNYDGVIVPLTPEQNDVIAEFARYEHDQLSY